MTMVSFAEVRRDSPIARCSTRTGLTGEFEVILNIAPEDYMPLMVRIGRQRRRRPSSTRRLRLPDGRIPIHSPGGVATSG